MSPAGKPGRWSVATKLGLAPNREGKAQQIANVHSCQGHRAAISLPCARSAEGRAGEGLLSLQATARERRNVFESLLEAFKTHSLGQISLALYEVDGEYRRNM